MSAPGLDAYVVVPADSPPEEETRMHAASRMIQLSLLLVLVALLGCPGPESPEPEMAPLTATSAASAEPEPAGEPIPAATPASSTPETSDEPVTLDTLNPRIRERGQAGMIPDRIEIRFEQPVVSRSNVRAASTTDVSITPKVEGRWTFKDRSTLTFKPAVGFAPETEYLVVLKAVQFDDGESLAGQRSYQRVFTTPALTLRRLELTRWQPSANRAELALVFAGPVTIRRPANAIVWTIDGIRRRVPIRRGSRPNVWIATVTDRGLKAGSLFEARVGDRAVFSAGGGPQPATGAASVTLPKDKAAFIRGVAVVEGADGFFLRVICHDEASQGRQLSFWDRDLQQSFRLSPRCVFDEEAAKVAIHLDPPLAFRTSPTRGGFRIHAPFARGPVQLTIDAGARTVDGGVIPSLFTRTVEIPARAPKLEFVAQGRYLPQSAWGTLAIRHLNVSKIRLRVRHVTKDNVIRWLSESGEATSYRNSDLLVDERLNLKGKPDAMVTASISLPNYLPKPPPGLVEVEVRQRKGGRARSTVRFAVTDLNVIAKRHRDGTVRAWVLNAHDHTPVANASVEMVVYSGRKISTCQTDGDGGCALATVDEDAVDKTEPFALIARFEDDFTFVRFDQLRLDTSGFDVHGATATRAMPYRLSVYSDRGVYRPGETAHIVGIIRTDKDEAPPVDMPVQIELLDPKSKVTRRLSVTTNEAGMVSADFKFADFADTGRYRARFKAGKTYLASYAFSVEEFVPERMEVTASAAEKSFGAEDDAKIEVSARYLFGGSAAGSRYDLRCQLTPAQFAPKQHPGYTFGVWRDQPLRAVQLGQVSGTLDADGQGELACPALTGRGKILGTTRLSAQVAVFESGSGRTTQGRATAMVHPAPTYVGLKSSVDQVKRDRTFTVEGVIVDWDGKVVDAVERVTIELLKVEREYGWVYDNIEGRWTNRRHTHLVKTQQLEAKVDNGRFKIALQTPETAPAFVVRARAGEVLGDLQLGGSWGYWWWGYYGYNNGDATPRPLKPEALEIKGPTDAAVGDTVDVSLEAPYAGRVLWTLESDGVKKARWQDVTPGPVKWSFEVDEFEPNVYVSALLLKDPHEESEQSYLPSRSYGVRSIRIRPEQYIQKVTIKAPDEVRSNQALEVEIELPGGERPSYVTVAAVDEGILSLTNFKTPQPVRELFRRQRLAVGTFETIGWNVSLPAGDLGRSTGGGGPGGPGRIQMVKPVALWSGLRQVPKEGPLKVRFEVPKYRGKLRVMVVGAGPKRLVSGERSVLVRDPIVLQATLPRFLVQGDEAQVPVFLTNLSGRDQKVTVRLKSVSLMPASAPTLGEDVSPVEVRGTPVRELELAKDGQATVIYRLSARSMVGAARLVVEAEAPGIKVSESLDVPFLANAPTTKTVQRIELPTGDIDLKPYLKGWLPMTETTKFWVTANPYGEVFDHLPYLVRYPYGCVEQTTSTLRPMLFLGGLVRTVDPKAFDEAKLEQAIVRGIDRILSMQTPSGGFGYWPGAQRPVYWGTAYATHALIDAKKQGFALPQSRIDDALSWMRRALTTSSDEPRVRASRAYMHYALALGGRGAKAEMLDLLRFFESAEPRRRWWTNTQYRDEMMFMLQAGLYLAGDQRFESELMAADRSPIRNDRTNGWAFYSDRRRRGLMLSILVDLFGPREDLEELAQVVGEGLTGQRSYWYTTQELAWGITGLGKMLGRVTNSFPAPTLEANGRALPPASIPSKKEDLGDRTFSLFRASEYESLVLRTQHADDDKVYLIVSSQGVKPDVDWRTGGETIEIQRRYRDERGEIIDPKVPMELGSLVYVELTIRNTSNAPIQNVAVVDRFPAAWEIENPRLGRDLRADWFDAQKRWYPEHMNLRDDRVEAFGTLPRRTAVKLIYLLRAVTAGQFTVPPVEAEAMYDPTRWARERGPRITVRGPWDDQ